MSSSEVGSDHGRRQGARQPTLVSVVLPCRNAMATLGAQIEALSAQTYEGAWELVVVDDRSADSSAGLALSLASRLPHLHLEHGMRRGVAAARNAGARAAAGDVIVSCDADDIADPEWLRCIVRCLECHDIVGGYIDTRTLNSPEVSHWYGGPHGMWLEAAFKERRLPTHARFLPFAVGSNMAIWRDVFEDIGGWDEGFKKVAGEDVDICWRAQLAGYRLGFCQAAVVHIRYPHTVRGALRQAFWYGRGDVTLYAKHRDRGIPRLSALRALRVYAFLIRCGPGSLIRRQERVRWLRQLAFRMGRFAGSVQQRVWYL